MVLFSMRFRGQGTFEYVLLLGGVLLIVVIALVTLQSAFSDSTTSLSDLDLKQCKAAASQDPECYIGTVFQPGNTFSALSVPAGTLCNAARALMDAGARSVAAYVTHGVLSGGAVARVTSSPIETMVTTDSIMATEAVRVAQNINHLTIAPLMAEAIKRISDESSVSSLFK